MINIQEIIRQRKASFREDAFKEGNRLYAERQQLQEREEEQEAARQQASDEQRKLARRQQLMNQLLAKNMPRTQLPTTIIKDKKEIRRRT